MENFEEPLGDERRRLLEQELRKDLHQFLLSMHQLYLFGAAMQLKRMGYHMTKMN